MVAHSGKRDIYELLGIDASASAVLAQDVYWRRVNAYLDADRAGDPEARRAIAELNEALAILTDYTRRAEYDRERRARVAHDEPSVSEYESRARRRSLVVVALVPVVGLAMWVALGFGPFAAVGAGLVGVVALLLAAHWANREIVNGMSPFRVLHLREDATVEDVQSAYQSEVGRLLLLVRTYPRALKELEALDAAYLRALDVIANGESGVPLPDRLTGRIGGLVARAVRGGGRGVIALGMLAVRLLTSLTKRASSAAGAAAHAGWSSARSGPPPAADLDVDHRLGSPLREVTERIAVGAPLIEPPPVVEDAPAAPAAAAVAAAPTAPPAPLVRAALVLESPAGARKVPVGTMPMRIGSDGGCDLVLRQDGVMPEHAMAWVREDVVVLHVIEQHASCLVNGQTMTWAVLEDGDEVRFGDARLTVSVSQ